MEVYDHFQGQRFSHKAFGQATPGPTLQLHVQVLQMAVDLKMGIIVIMDIYGTELVVVVGPWKIKAHILLNYHRKLTCMRVQGTMLFCSKKTLKTQAGCTLRMTRLLMKLFCLIMGSSPFLSLLVLCDRLFPFLFIFSFSFFKCYLSKQKKRENIISKKIKKRMGFVICVSFFFSF